MLMNSIPTSDQSDQLASTLCCIRIDVELASFCCDCDALMCNWLMFVAVIPASDRIQNLCQPSQCSPWRLLHAAPAEQGILVLSTPSMVLSHTFPRPASTNGPRTNVFA